MDADQRAGGHGGSEVPGRRACLGRNQVGERVGVAIEDLLLSSEECRARCDHARHGEQLLGFLLVNEGYGGRVDLAAEALRLGAALVELMPDEPEVHGLHALMLLNDARREARFEGGELVLLADQDRSRWDPARIARGREAFDRALALQGGGPYVVQAAIASLHMEEPPDWPQIAGLYGELVRLTGSPVVELNRAIAVAEAKGAEAGLALVDRLDLDGYQYFHSTRADLLRRLGRWDEARIEYERALELADSEPERRFLQRRVSEATA